MPSSFRPSLRAGGPRTQGVPMPSSFRPSLRAGDPRTQDAEAFLFPPPLAGRWPAHPGCRGLPLSAPLCGPVARAPRMQRPSSLRPSLRAGDPRTQGVPMPSSLRPSLRAGDPRTQGAEAFLSPPLSAGRWPAHPGCRGLPLSAPLCGPVARAPRGYRCLPLSAPLCGPVARAPRVQRPSSLRPSLRAGGPRTQGAEAFLSPPLSAGRWPAHPGIHVDKSAASAYSNVACWQRLRRV
jgi:hypothetical protein